MPRSQAQQRIFDELQQDEKFRSWVAMNEAVLELEFDDVPGIPERSWDGSALDLAESVALELFASAADAFSPEKSDTAWRFVRFIGQTFIDGFEGAWVNIPASKGFRQRLGVDLPFRTMYIEPIGMLRTAVHGREGHSWATVYDYAAEDYEEYLQTSSHR